MPFMPAAPSPHTRQPLPSYPRKRVSIGSCRLSILSSAEGRAVADGGRTVPPVALQSFGRCWHGVYYAEKADSGGSHPTPRRAFRRGRPSTWGPSPAFKDTERRGSSLRQRSLFCSSSWPRCRLCAPIVPANSCFSLDEDRRIMPNRRAVSHGSHANSRPPDGEARFVPPPCGFFSPWCGLGSADEFAIEEIYGEH